MAEIKRYKAEVHRRYYHSRSEEWMWSMEIMGLSMKHLYDLVMHDMKWDVHHNTVTNPYTDLCCFYLWNDDLQMWNYVGRADLYMTSWDAEIISLGGIGDGEVCSKRWFK